MRKKSTPPLMQLTFKQEWAKTQRLSSMTLFGSNLTLLSMLWITFKLVSTSTRNVCGTVKHFWSQGHLELKPILRWSFLLRLNAMVTLRIHLKSLYRCVLSETSLTRLNTASNGEGTYSVNYSMMLLMIQRVTLKSLNPT